MLNKQGRFFMHSLKNSFISSLGGIISKRLCCQIDVSDVIFSLFNTIKVMYSGYFYFDNILKIIQLCIPLS